MMVLPELLKIIKCKTLTEGIYFTFLLLTDKIMKITLKHITISAVSITALIFTFLGDFEKATFFYVFALYADRFYE